MEFKKILLVDGSNLAFRMFFALERTGLTAPDGRPSWAIFGFLKAIFEVIIKEKPTVLVACFDSQGGSFRTEKADFYKANRPTEMPPDLRIQWPEIQRGLKLMGFQILAQPGVEADDLIGTLAVKAQNANWQVDILSGDKDVFQLVNNSVSVLYPVNSGGTTKMGFKEVKAKMGVRPDQVVDFKALCGDSSDNIPGVLGIGEKSASGLLSKFTNLEDIYESIEEITPPSLQKKLIEGHDSALLSRFLAQIKTDCQVTYDFESNAHHLNPDHSGLKNFLTEYKLTSLEKSLPKIFEILGVTDNDLFSPNEIQKERKKLLNFKTSILNENSLQNLLKIKPENLGLEVFKEGTKVFFSLSFRNSFELETLNLVLNLNQDQKEIKQECLRLNDFFQNCDSIIYVYDLKNVHKILIPQKIFLPKNSLCIKMAGFVENSNQVLDLPDLLKLKLGYDSTPKIGDKTDQIGIFCSQNACSTLLLGEYFEKSLTKKLEFVWKNMESPLAYVLAKIELKGVYINQKSLKTISEELLLKAETLENEIKNQLNNFDFNLNSSQQLSSILMSKGYTLGKTSKGSFSTDRFTLEKLALTDDTGLIEKILQHRTLIKLRSTYTESLQNWIDKKDNRVHGDYNSAGAATGRLSSVGPNLQNIPIKNPTYGKLIRSCFAAENNNVLIDADYSQLELRFLAHFSGDAILKEAFENNQDIHARTAAEIFEVDLAEVTKEQRAVGKTLNFALLYQQGSFATSRQLKISNKEAKRIIEKYFAKFPAVRPFINQTIEFARKNGFVETFWGRRRYFTNLNASNISLQKADERAAFNAVLQGSNADLLKLAMVRFQEEIEKTSLKAQIILQVHDELVVETTPEHLEAVKTILINSMTLNQPLKVPIVVETGQGKNWAEAKI